MTGKRQHESNSPLKSHKKQKTKDARTIAVQSSSQTATSFKASSAEHEGGSSTGKSRLGVRFQENSMEGLPPTIDVEKFVKAREFEVEAMQNSMLTAKADATKRAWQTLPRHLRRRAASHDARRVPVRLRDKARVEIAPKPNKKVSTGSSRRGMGRRVTRTEALLKRQIDKTWLETHIWHAKRMKMENLWGYRLAVKPTEKAFRPSHRAAIHSAILNDVSYFSIIEVRGRQNAIILMLRNICDPQLLVSSKRYIDGSRICYVHAYESGDYPYNLIGPISIIWKPVDLEWDGISSDGPGIADAATRAIWIRSHPAIYAQLHRAICNSVMHLGSVTQRSAQVDMELDNDKAFELEVADLRNDINVFEITGPRSSQVIAGALRLAKGVSARGRKFWTNLPNLHTPGSVPRGMVIGLRVHDPRLSFPPTNAQPRMPDIDNGRDMEGLTPHATLAANPLWDPKIRTALQKPKFTKYSLDERREKNLAPGTPLRPLESDDRIPIMMIQHTISESRNPHRKTSHTESSMPELHGWTIMLPSGWAMAFFSSLTFTGTRVGGLRERATQHFETATPHFPSDYVTTDAYETQSEQMAQDAREKWERTPKGKRVSYSEQDSPWKVNWDGLLQIVRPDEVSERDLIPTQPKSGDVEDTAMLVEAKASNEAEKGHSRPQAWLLHGPSTEEIVQKAISEQEDGVSSDIIKIHVDTLRAKNGLLPRDESPQSLVASALIMVKLIMCGRGTPEDLGAIYEIPEQEELEWRRCMNQKDAPAAGLADDDSEGARPPVTEPSPSSIIGHVTTGNFSLQLGKGHALGSVSLQRWIIMMKRASTDDRERCRCMVKIRSSTSKNFRAAWMYLNSS